MWVITWLHFKIDYLRNLLPAAGYYLCLSISSILIYTGKTSKLLTRMSNNKRTNNDYGKSSRQSSSMPNPSLEVRYIFILLCNELKVAVNIHIVRLSKSLKIFSGYNYFFLLLYKSKNIYAHANKRFSILQDHAAFKTLLAQKDPGALKAWDGYLKSNDQSEFFRSFLRVVQQSSKNKTGKEITICILELSRIISIVFRYCIAIIFKTWLCPGIWVYR